MGSCQTRVLGNLARERGVAAGQRVRRAQGRQWPVAGPVRSRHEKRLATDNQAGTDCRTGGHESLDLSELRTNEGDPAHRAAQRLRHLWR